MSDIFGEGEKQDVLAVDLSAKAAIEVIEELDTVDAAVKFLSGEGRITVLRAAEKKFPVLADTVLPDPMAAAVGQPAEMPEPEVDEDLSEETGASAAGGRRYLIEIDEVEGRPNFEVVGVNGTVYRIKRGEPVEVPESVLEVLNHAVAERIVQQDDGTGKIQTRRQRYSAVPYRVLKAL